MNGRAGAGGVNGMKRRLRSSWWLLSTFFALLFALTVDCLVFNLPHWQTVGIRHDAPVTLTIGKGLQRTADGSLEIRSRRDATLTITTKDRSPVRYVRLDGPKLKPQRYDPTKPATTNEGAAQLVNFTLAYHAQGNDGWLTGAERFLHPSAPRTRYVHIGGGFSDVRITFTDAEGTVLPVTGLTADPDIPYETNVLRLGLLFLFFLIVMMLRPGSRLYRIRLNPSHAAQVAVLAGVTLAQLMIAIGIWRSGAGASGFSGTYHPAITNRPYWVDYDQYARLGDALIHGRVNLDLPVPDELAAMDNPYDTTARNQIGANGAIPIYWDHAFFRGKYYCYFGVIPAVLLFVPYQLITGSWLPTGWAVLVMACAAVVLGTAFVACAARTYFRETASLGTAILAICAINLGSGMCYQLVTPNFYSLPGITSYAFTLAGLCCWLKAKHAGRAAGDTGHTDGTVGLSKPWLAMGSLCIAANLGCRPQFIFSALLALPIFWDELVRRRLFFSRKGWPNVLVALLPFAIVFAPLMAYNYARFGSPLDFGNNYNLTGFDLTQLQRSTNLILPTALSFLFQPVDLTMQFPFLATQRLQFPAWSPAEGIVGGFFAFMPVMALVLAAPFLARRTESGRDLIWCSFALALGTIAIDIQLGSLAWRYFIDFGYALVVAFVFTVFHIDADREAQVESKLEASECGVLERSRGAALLRWNQGARVVIGLAVAALLLTYVLQFFGMLGDRYHPQWYYDIAGWFIPLW